LNIVHDVLELIFAIKNFMRRIFILIMASVLVSGCESPRESVTTKSGLPMDIHSYHQKSDARVSHLSLMLTADFDEQILRGIATWTVESKGSDTIWLDTRGLEIFEVYNENAASLEFGLTEEDSILGRALWITGIENVKKVSIKYATSPGAEAIQWLTPAGRAPFMFTQSQAILARTWIPCPDSPGWRFTYDAVVNVPKHLMALMSAENPEERNENGVYRFEMKQHIPSYLMALAIGDVYFKNLGERSGVYAESDMLDAAAYEFSEVEDMIAAAEALYGPYEWERYDILVLPASFPFGGMENPRLTFATPTIITGDRSLTALIAHELAHSWSGNLVTNATWNDFWINEGFTVYFEHRIMEAVYGRDYSEMLARLSYVDVKEEVEDFLKTRPNDTRLKLDLAGRNPDDGVSRIAYDKGYFFLRLIEETVGREAFDAFLLTYFQTHRFGVMTTEKFLDYLRKNLLSDEQWDEIGVNEWVYEIGLPENCPYVVSERFQKVMTSIKHEIFSEGRCPDNTENWSTHEWVYFLVRLRELQVLGDQVNEEMLSMLDSCFALTASKNSEILAAWWQIVVPAKYKAAYPAMEDFLVHVGRRKFLTPTYRALKETNQLADACAIYQKARPNYHFVSRQTMDELLGNCSDE
jgi:leukotriene-A4 hydrolase